MFLNVPKSWANLHKKSRFYLPERGGWKDIPFGRTGEPLRKDFGHPVKKESRIGRRGLNKCGHRNNPHKK